VISPPPILRWLLIVCLLACPALLHAEESVEELGKKVVQVKAEQGFALAQFSLGLLYATGDGVLKNEAEAAKWFRKAVEQGLADAQCNLGVCYANGNGVVKNDVEGYEWLLLPAANGIENAKKNASIVERRLSHEQRAEGQRLATEWQAAFEKKQKDE
jgi:hypothetical protein